MIKTFVSFLNSFSLAATPTIRELVDARFNDYPATYENQLKKAKQVNFSSLPKAKKYRTYIKRYFQNAKEPNFAGRFIMVDNIGCGTSCVVPFIIDYETGNISSAPVREQHIRFRADSNLIVYGGSDDPTYTLAACGHMIGQDPYLLIFEAGKFHPAKEQICQSRKD